MSHVLVIIYVATPDKNKPVNTLLP